MQAETLVIGAIALGAFLVYCRMKKTTQTPPPPTAFASPTATFISALSTQCQRGDQNACDQLSRRYNVTQSKYSIELY